MTSAVRQQDRHPGERVLFTETLSNGITVTCLDISRTIAGDRWYVGLRCQASLPLAACTLPGEDDLELASRIRQSVGKTFCLIQIKEKHFVAQQDKDSVLQDCLHRIHANLLPHLAHPAFPSKLMQQQYKKARQRCLVEERRQADDGDTTDQGPADFSACFRD